MVTYVNHSTSMIFHLPVFVFRTLPSSCTTRPEAAVVNSQEGHLLAAGAGPAGHHEAPGPGAGCGAGLSSGIPGVVVGLV